MSSVLRTLIQNRAQSHRLRGPILCESPTPEAVFSNVLRNEKFNEEERKKEKKKQFTLFQ
ncbi:hypothetical protein BTE48_16465 [Oceanospirillum multiglobuliferum]|uniref:Uncharacterized protein n=1 Tax=Oceanospirillum multiglobuliferum TaxID=64969 RepID=A0A1V4T091_9GAMM|nr:hypothetical protein BTE48_16465 [Oceanospirillum multiglobuliferum]